MSRTSTADRRTTAAVTLLAAAAALAAGACTDVSERSQATAEISGPDETSVRVITSTDFVRGSQGTTDPTVPDTSGVSVNLVSADTTERTLPAEVSQALTETQRFFINVALTDSAEAGADGPVEAEMRVLVDGEQRARVQSDLLDIPLQVVFTSFVSR